MPLSVDELIETLDDVSGAGEDAKYELIARGVEIVPELAARVGTLGRFGNLTAIEAFEVAEDGHLYRTESAHAEWDFDWSARWMDCVAAARQAASDAAATVAPELLVRIEWVDESDLAAGPAGGA